MEKVLFVSEIKDPVKSGSSTQIMTENILTGLRDNGYSVTLIAIVDAKCNADNVTGYFGKSVDGIQIMRSRLNLILHTNKYDQLFRNIRGALWTHAYKKLISDIPVNEYALMISHTPSLEAAFVCREIKKTRKSLRYVQYWSDPYALAGILPENFGVKRYPSYCIEYRILSQADSIVYGTRMLAQFQKRMYPRMANKMGYCNVSYKPSNPERGDSKCGKKDLLFGYTGDYGGSMRNIMPLYNVFFQRDDVKLFICGRTTLKLQEKENIEIRGFIPQKQISDYEKAIDVMVCLLNSNNIQIPGKIFYHTNTDKIILVVLDGKYAGFIREYLDLFHRFEFCENNEESIEAVIDKIQRGDCEISYDCLEQLSPIAVAASICRGGLKI